MDTAKLKRYDISGYEFDCDEHLTGEWVRFADVQALIAAPQPPAFGGEADVFIHRYSESCGEGGGVYATKNGELCDYHHVERLQAEIVRLKAASDANFASVQRVEQERNRVSEHRATIIAERDTLLAEIERLKAQETELEYGVLLKRYTLLATESDTLMARCEELERVLGGMLFALQRPKNNPQ